MTTRIEKSPVKPTVKALVKALQGAGTLSLHDMLLLSELVNRPEEELFTWTLVQDWLAQLPNGSELGTVEEASLLPAGALEALAGQQRMIESGLIEVDQIGRMRSTPSGARAIGAIESLFSAIRGHAPRHAPPPPAAPPSCAAP